MMRFFLGFTVLLLSACTVGPNYHRPDVQTPKQWSVKTSTPQGTVSDKWWQSFLDPVLDRLINDAIAANLDLKLSLQRVIDARALRTETIAAGLPIIGANTNVNRRLNSINSGSGGNTGMGGFGFGNQISNIFSMGFDAKWELDFFGGIQRAVEAADANVDVEIENSRDVLITLLGEVARNYIELRANQQLIEITRANIKSQQDSLSLLDIRYKAGLSGMLEVSQQQAQLSSTEAQLPVYQSNTKLAIHALSVLLNQPPDALIARLELPAGLPDISKLNLSALPSDLLQRRPDIRKAEREMARANAYIGIATAELFPKVNLAAFIGLQNSKLSDFTPMGKSWSTAASITMPIFNWGKLNANIKSKKSQYQQTFLIYQSTVLEAFREVEDALVTYSNEQKRIKSLQQAVAANQLAVALANERYLKGLSGFINVLESLRAQYLSQSSLLESEAKRITSVVALYKALGGGWQSAKIVNDGCYHYADKSLVSQFRDFIKPDCSK
jgi:NodT family efflux transporter outer membrane factor (OMF) lipoprotein